MPIARKLRASVFALAALMGPLPFANAQTHGAQMVAIATTPGSFGMGPMLSSAPAKAAAHSKANGVRANNSRAGVSASGIAGGAKINNSIASELAGSKSVPWSIVVGLTLLTLLPALLLSMTPLVRLLVVFHFLRQALGTQTAPSNQVLMGLALMMTWFLMQPVLLEVEQTAVAPYSAGTITGSQAMDFGVAPVKRYMMRYAREKDLAVFASAGMAVRPNRK